jgi:gas vesicle protein
VSSASVLAADGLGTDVYTGPGNATFTITKPTTVTPETVPEPTEEPEPKEETEEGSDAAITFGEPPRAPEAGSTVFLEPEKWYATKSGLFTWETPFDIDELALDISTSSDFNPTTRYKPPIDEIALNDTLLIDGVQYLTLQYRNQVGWGAILHRKILIDTVPPEKFAINVNLGNSATSFPFLTFEAKDTISGIEKYEMTIADGEPLPITPDEAKLGYQLKNLEDGTYTIRVTAYDLAGNKTESSVPVRIVAGWKPPVEVVVAGSIWDIFKGKNLIILILLGMIGALIGYIMMQRKAQEHREQKLRKETKEIQDQMEKIFSALRDEIYDQINMITKKERLSKKEREAVEGLNQALEVSETLIEKEITDVSKILK